MPALRRKYSEPVSTPAGWAVEGNDYLIEARSLREGQAVGILRLSDGKRGVLLFSHGWINGDNVETVQDLDRQGQRGELYFSDDQDPWTNYTFDLNSAYSPRERVSLKRVRKTSANPQERIYGVGAHGPDAHGMTQAEAVDYLRKRGGYEGGFHLNIYKQTASGWVKVNVRGAHPKKSNPGPLPMGATATAYVDAALFSSTDDNGIPLDQDYTVDDIDPATLRQMIADADGFVEKYGELIAVGGGDYEQAGHDFWLTRNRHGAGFWDGDWPNGDELTAAAHTYGEFDLYVGEDGMVYGHPLTRNPGNEIPLFVSLPPAYAQSVAQVARTFGLRASVKTYQGRRSGRDDVWIPADQSELGDRLAARIAHEAKRNPSEPTDEQLLYRLRIAQGVMAGTVQSMSRADAEAIIKQSAAKGLKVPYGPPLLKSNGRCGKEAFARMAHGKRNPVHVSTITQGDDRADVFQVAGKEFRTIVQAGKHAAEETFGSLDAAMNWARLKLHEMTGVTRNALPSLGMGISHVVGQLARRPNPEDAAKRMFEVFHGYPSDQVLEYRQKQHAHEWLAGLGPLMSLHVMDIRGKNVVVLGGPDPAEAGFDEIVQATVSEDGRQIYFVGGDQDMPFDLLKEKFGMTDDDVRDTMLIGTVVQLTYQTRKTFEKEAKVKIDFFHDLGGEHSKGVCPALIFRPRDKQMELAGGRYYVAPPESSLDGVSPGIVG